MYDAHGFGLQGTLLDKLSTLG